MPAKKWEKMLSKSIHAKDLLKKHPEPGINQKDVLAINKLYPIQITPHYEDIINWDNPEDPLLRLVFPRKEEFSKVGNLDTSGEKYNIKLKGLQHKYEPTVLLKAADTCFSYCRFCFRRRNIGKPKTEELEEFSKAVKYIKKHPECNNVLITGGDPLMRRNHRIDAMLTALRKIPHVKIIRLGTRMLAYLPQRITSDPGLVKILKKHSLPEKKLYIVTHFEHPREITKETVKAVQILLKNGIILYNQTVLLAGVNDNPKVIRELFEKLTEIGVTPYYFFQCRPVKGINHFRVPLLKGSKIFETAKKEMSGLPKTARYTMSTKAGKIEIVNVYEKKGWKHCFLEFISSKNKQVIGDLMHFKYKGDAYWADDLVKKCVKYEGDKKALAELKKNLIFK